MTPTSENVVTLEIKGLGHVPSMKNQKMLTRGRLITKPERQKFMQRVIRLFESQLMSLSATTGGGISTAHSRQSLIALLPADDSFQHVSEITIKSVKVPKGQEGAFIRIERMTP